MMEPMSMISPGRYLLTHYGFTKTNSQPTMALAGDHGVLVSFEPRGHHLTLEFDTSRHFCTGWHDLRTAVSGACPDRAQTGPAYEQCRSCQQRTGFNPAFYNATSVSPQQQERNQQPHILYLAQFAPGVVKVGISLASRGMGRLLEQGARSCVVLRTFPDAHQARDAEARIARLPGIAETIQVRQKLQFLTRPYDMAAAALELSAVQDRLATELGLDSADAKPQSLDRYYLDKSAPRLDEAVDTTKDAVISGRCLGAVGGILVCTQADHVYLCSLSKLKGYYVTISDQVKALDHAPVQMGMF
jgi:hypothetical protein